DGQTELDEAALRGKFLSGVTEDLFGSMFALDHNGLAEGGKAALDSGGALGQLLFGAGLDLVKLRRFQKKLNGRMSELFLPKGQKPEINKAIGELEQARREIDEACLRSSAYQEQEAARKEAQERGAQIDRGRLATAAELARLERFETALEE